MKLLYTPFSPFSRKVRVVAHEKGLDDRLELVLTEVGTHVPLASSVHDRLAQITPLMKIPVLVQGDVALYNSRVICEYLDSLAPRPPMFPPPGEARWRALKRQATADGMMEAAILCRFEDARPAGRAWQDWTEAQARRIALCLDSLADDPPAEGELDIGVVSIACALGYLDFRFGHMGWRTGRPALTRWFEGFSSRQSIASTDPERSTGP